MILTTSAIAQVVPLSGNSTIHGAPVFHRLVVEGDVNSVRLTNNVDVAALAAGAIYADEPVNTDAHWKVTEKRFYFSVQVYWLCLQVSFWGNNL